MDQGLIHDFFYGLGDPGPECSGLRGKLGGDRCGDRGHSLVWLTLLLAIAFVLLFVFISCSG